MNFNHKELNNKISRLLDKNLTPEEFRELERILIESPEARDHYYKYMRLHLALEINHSLVKKTQSGSRVISMDLVLEREKKRQLKLSALVAIASVVIICFFLALRDSSGSPPLSFRVTPNTKFNLTHRASHDSPQDDFTLTAGSKLEISQGSVELNFASGVKSIVKAPASITLQAEDTLNIDQGSAWFEVPKKAIGFKVVTPNMHVVDLGTEFGVSTCKDSKDEIHVFKGKVKVTTTIGAEEEAILTSGMARKVDYSGRLKEHQLETLRFANQLPKNLPYTHWSFDKTRNHTFTAEGNTPELKNTNASPKAADLTTMIKQGKFGNCVSYTGKNGQELITRHPGFDPKTPLTICFWVKLPAPSQRSIHAPLLAWAIPNDPNKILSKLAGWEFHAIPSDDNSDTWNLMVSCAGWAQGSANIADGQWHHMTTVFTGKTFPDGRPELLFYHNGERDPISLSKADHYYSYADYSDYHASQPIVIGAGSLSPKNRTRVVSNSQLDELYIIQGELNQKQIVSLMKTNRFLTP